MQRRKVSFIRALALFALLLVFAAPLFARVGGGSSYSGGGSDSGGGGGGGGGEIAYLVIRLLFWLTIHHPVIGVPVDIVVIVIVIRWGKSKSGNPVLRVSTAAIPVASAPRSLDLVRRFDPNFSEITFRDFCYSLYGRAHVARGAGDLDRYAPYLSTAARQALRMRNPAGLQEVRGVIVGAMQIDSVTGGDTTSIVLAFESNYTEVAGGAESSWYVREEWTLQRLRNVVSPPPEQSKADHCPRCGAPLQTRTDGSCSYCGIKIESGAFQWYVQAIALRSPEARGPLLTSNVPERGTELPTIVQPRFSERQAAFVAQHPDFRWPEFEARVRDIATTLQDAWSARDWERVRPLETESLFQMHRYWIDAYRRQKLRNVVADFTITSVVPARIDSDAFYEAITVRLYAQGRDATFDESGRVVAGSATSTRTWSEYWTLIRTRAAGPGGTMTCPNCGAKVDVGATGICAYCGGKLSVGAFDWILSRIEQDEEYRG
ncbi:MAG: TIM44-like domain-containing protein [Acidobacteria bacterium]|nr:TIM44-like domain-containing protein [Acidobacteriota bacterium]